MFWSPARGDDDRDPTGATVHADRRGRGAWPPVDWDAIEAEACNRGCTVADVVYERAGRRFLDTSF
jgi:hypothetical protein